MGVIDWFYTWFFKLKAFPLVIQISFIFILISLASVFLFQFYIIILRRGYAIKEKIEKEARPSLDELFRDIIFKNKYQTKEEIIEAYYKIVDKKSKTSFFKRNKNKENLIKSIGVEILIDIKKKSKIETNKLLLDRYLQIVNALEIEKFLYKKMDIKSVSSKKDAISDLSNIGLSSADSKILPLIYNKDTDVQVEAGLGYLQLSKNNPYRFFDEVKGVLTEWYQLKLMSILIKQLETTGDLPNFGKWISFSTNNYLIIFLLKATAFFDQKKSIPVVRVKTSDKDVNVRAEAFLVIGKLHDTEFEDILKQRYYNQPDKCQIAILKAISFLNTGKSIGFLENVFKEQSSIDVRKQIALIIYNYGKEGRLLFNKLKNEIQELVNKEKEFKIVANIDLLYQNLLFKHIENDLILFK